MSVNPATASLYAVNPLPRSGVATLFMTHPPIGERIRRLRALDGDSSMRLVGGGRVRTRRRTRGSPGASHDAARSER
jgi:hypothetical protein